MFNQLPAKKSGDGYIRQAKNKRKTGTTEQSLNATVTILPQHLFAYDLIFPRFITYLPV